MMTLVVVFIFRPLLLFFFFFNDTATTEIYTLSLHDALPICRSGRHLPLPRCLHAARPQRPDRKSTRLNSSHHRISYAVFCLKKKKKVGDLSGREEDSSVGKWRRGGIRV